MLINKREFSEEEIKNACALATNKQEFADALGYKCYNGRIYKVLDNLVIQLNLDNSHFDRYLANKLRAKYEKVNKICPVCEESFEVRKASPKEATTCSVVCSNTFFSDIRHTAEARLKTSLSLRKHSFDVVGYKKIGNRNYAIVKKICVFCNNDFSTLKKKQKCCSNKCSLKLKQQDPEYRKKFSIAIRKAIADGRHKGWASRNKLMPSFPEKVTMEILAELGISYYIREYKCSKWFIDFADVDRKIALEIDGKQHELPERKASDQVKDAYLLQEGWKVYRIKWEKLTKESREFLKDKIKLAFSDIEVAAQ